MAYGVRSHKFCCCLPVRFGVFVLSLLQFLSSALLAGVSYWAISQKDERLDSKYKLATIIMAAVMTLLALISFLGFIGTVMRRQNLVKAFSIALNYMFALSIGVGIAAIVLLFVRSKDELIKDCIDDSTDQDVINACQHIDAYRGATIAIIVVNWLIGLYECIIVSSYVSQLQEEKEAHWKMSAMKTYEQVPRRDSFEDHHHPATNYPNADKSQSYGYTGYGNA